tara:strand:+ start:179 stop:481 length:303 start_codon:yes stop_codon:yes gene_type:complete
MPKICREEDSFNTGHSCDPTSKLATPSQTTVFVEGKLVARKGDPTDSHDILVGDTCTPHTSSIVGDCSPNVFVEGKAVARVGDAVDAGAMTGGASDVSVN